MKMKAHAGAALAALTLGVMLAATLALPANAQMGAPAATATRASAVNSETGAPTQSQLKMDTKQFLRTHKWNEIDGTWPMKSGTTPASTWPSSPGQA